MNIVFKNFFRDYPTFKSENFESGYYFREDTSEYIILSGGMNGNISIYARYECGKLTKIINYINGESPYEIMGGLSLVKNPMDYFAYDCFISENF